MDENVNMLVFISALLIARIAVGAGRKAGLLDRPDSRKQHLGIVPLTGGISIYLAVLFGSYALGITPYTYEMLSICTVVFVVGVFDDFHSINPVLRLLIQYASGIALATYGGISITNSGNLLAMGNIPLLILAVPLTALSVAGLSNAYNMIDGIDGLAASMIALPLLILYALALQADHAAAPALFLILAPVGVFLLFNLGPDNRLLPKMFLGDGGSITLGFLVTASLVYFSQSEDPLILPVTALWLVTVPLMDMLATMLIRFRQRRKLMEADRSHLHYRLMDFGLTASQTLAALVIYAALCALAGIALEGTPEYISLLCFFILFCVHCLFVVKSDISEQNVATPSKG